MFTGLVKGIGIVKNVETISNNITLKIEFLPWIKDLQIDESISHNGICLTVEKIMETSYQVTAIDETIKKTNIGTWNAGDYINLERAMTLSDKLGGHIVQGHVDCMGHCLKIENKNGSTEYTFSYPPEFAALIIEKGSICVNGTSLTAFQLENNTFKVAIIPFTFENTIFQYIQIGDSVNLEFDILGKYILRQKELSI